MLSGIGVEFIGHWEKESIVVVSDDRSRWEKNIDVVMSATSLLMAEA